MTAERPSARPANTALVGRGRHYLERGGRAFLPVGAHFVPAEGPDWPWRVGPEAFDQAFEQMAALGLDTARIDLLWAAVEPDPGRYDEAHLRQLDGILEAARRHRILLHPTLFIGGEVGDAYWDVPWRAGRHPHRDPELRRGQAEHAAMLARRWRSDPAIVAWDLTDEPPFWPFPDPDDADALAWTAAIAGALRGEDPEHLITIGTSAQETGWGPFRADVVAAALDFACVHPYPIYQPELYPDALLAPRMTRSAAFEMALAAGAGRPVMLHEYGASSAQFDPEAIAAYDRLLAWSSLGQGAIGFYAWCWTDAEPAAFRRAPYVRQPHETQFGVTDALGGIRPRGKVLGDLAATIRRLDLEAGAVDGPARAVAAIVVPHEYSHPYNPAAFGLSEAPSGPYRPSEAFQHPARDPKPLIRSLLNAFVMAGRAGLSVGFPREALDDAWPDAPLLVLPAPLATTSISLWHLRTSYWHGAEEFLARRGSLYVSLSADAAIPEMAALAGCSIADRAPADRAPVLRLVEAWGPFLPGDELALPPWDGTLGTRGVRLRLADGDVIAVDGDGNPALVRASRGSGHVVTCAFPVELLLAAVPDAHGASDRSWGLYAGLADLVAVTNPSAFAGVARSTHPELQVGTLWGDRGGVAVTTNHSATTVEAPLRLPPDASLPRIVDGDGEHAMGMEGGAVLLRLAAHGAAIVAWDEVERTGG